MVKALLTTVTSIGIAGDTVILYAKTKKLASKTYPTHREAFDAFLNTAKEIAKAH